MCAYVAVVRARTDPAAGARGVTAFLVPRDLPGIERLPFDDMGFKTIGRALMTMDDVRVPAKYRLGGESSGLRAIVGVFDWLKVFLILQAQGEQLVYDGTADLQRTILVREFIGKEYVSYTAIELLVK